MASRITSPEWIMLLLGAAGLDATQFMLDLEGVGEFLNPEIDIAVGPILAGYEMYRGVDRSKGMIATWILAPVFEFFTDGFLPIGWVSEVAIAWWLDSRNKKQNKKAA